MGRGGPYFPALPPIGPAQRGRDKGAPSLPDSHEGPQLGWTLPGPKVVAEVGAGAPTPSSHAGRGSGLWENTGEVGEISFGFLLATESSVLKKWDASGGRRGFLAPTPMQEGSRDDLSPPHSPEKETETREGIRHTKAAQLNQS